MNELEEALRCLKHEIKQFKDTQLNQTKLDQTLRCLKYEIKLLKKRPINEDSTIPSAIEERSVETPIDHNEELETVKNSVNELEEALRCLKHEIKQLKSTPIPEPVVSQAPVEESTPVDLTPVENDIRCLKYEVKRLKERPVDDIESEEQSCSKHLVQVNLC